MIDANSTDAAEPTTHVGFIIARSHTNLAVVGLNQWIALSQHG